MSRRLGVVLNPASGGTPDVHALRSLFPSDAAVEFFVCDGAADPTALARRAVAAGCEAVVAAGGDGTVGSVAAGLVSGPIPLGILPCGTANSVAAALGIPADLDAAARLLESAGDRVVDVAHTDRGLMLLHASVGLHASAIAGTPPAAKRTWGRLAYLVTGLRRLRQARPFRATLETDAERIRCRATSVTVANFGPLQSLVAQGPSRLEPDDALLDATILAAAALGDVLRSFLHLAHTARAGLPAERDDVGYVSSHRFRIDADPPQPVLLDGEASGSTPLEVRIVPASLRVLAPPATRARRGRERKLTGLPGLRVTPLGAAAAAR